MHRTRISLDGSWSFYTDTDSSLTLKRLDESVPLSVAVPAPWQTQAPDLRHYNGTAWYRRSFHLPAEWSLEDAVQAVILGFGAVDYYAEVWVNGLPAGEHEGGYLPFELEITRLVHPGENQVAVRVRDPLEIFAEIPHGKQSWYGLLSGIWQSVWIERRPATHIRNVRATPLVAEERVDGLVRLNRPLAETERLHVEVLSPTGERVSEADVQASDEVLAVSLPVLAPRLWELDSPHLYTLRVSLEGQQPDEVRETFGFRTVEAREGRILLNGRPIFLRGALDQDYYPDLVYTPPSMEFIEDQFRKAKAMGLNCLRTHIKIADPRYYAAADRAGLLIWTELPNWQTLTSEARRRAHETLTGMVDRDWNHPSIIIWTVINESWGIDLTDPNQRAWLVETYDFLKSLDPYRLVVGNSACWGNFQVVTDLEDFHAYYAIPDHYRKWRNWVRNFAGRPSWTFAHAYQDYTRWRTFRRKPWKRHTFPPAAEVRRRMDEPLLLSEFGNWGLPDVGKLTRHYGGEPWWFNTGLEWGEGVVYPHGIEDRFRIYHLDRVFPSLESLTQASQQQQLAALKYEIEQIRRQDSLSGFVITEFTDVHWECNGLLDMCRNPKVVAEEIQSINAEDVIIPDWQQLSYWEGERCRIDLYLSHYSDQDLHGSRIQWQLNLRPDLCGELTGLRPRAAGVSRAGRIEFEVPPVPASTSVQIQFRLVKRDGTPVAENKLELFFYPRLSATALSLRLYAPELAASLGNHGYRLVDKLQEADAAVALTLTDELRRYLLDGGRVLWLAENDQAQQTYLGELNVKPRRKKVWEGDWANSLTWICQDRVFSGLPAGGLLNFSFADLTPDHVITGLKPIDYACRVHAGLAVGWLNKVAGVVAEHPLGQGNLLISTFQLSRQIDRHPLSLILIKDMLKYLCRDNR